LFVHEVKRVFFDRCISTSDVDIMQKYLEDAMGGDCFQKTEVDSFMEEPLIYEPFSYEIKEGEFMMQPISTWDGLKKVLEEKLAEYNETNIVMNLVLFKDAMCHICRIIRILF
jgi:dynein heavy chain